MDTKLESIVSTMTEEDLLDLFKSKLYQVLLATLEDRLEFIKIEAIQDTNNTAENIAGHRARYEEVVNFIDQFQLAVKDAFEATKVTQDTN